MPPSEPCPPVLATLTRDGVVESVHRGAVTVCDDAGVVLHATGPAGAPVYARSALKPFQVLAVLEVIEGHVDLSDDALAIACASHEGGDDHQIEAAHLLALADLDEGALGCPPADPADRAALRDSPEPTRLAHNCSGKHAAFLLAEVTAGRDPSGYLDPAGALQRSVRDHLERSCAAALDGPGVDGCGAPAWLLPLTALATGFARLAAGADPRLARVRRALRARPDLVGGTGQPDTALMRSAPGVVAKRGAEAVFAAGAVVGGRGLGVAVKLADGGSRAAGPVAAQVLSVLGLPVSGDLCAPVVLGGGEPHGALRVPDPLVERLRGDLLAGG
jgi:L-asparaginase II